MVLSIYHRLFSTPWPLFPIAQVFYATCPAPVSHIWSGSSCTPFNWQTNSQTGHLNSGKVQKSQAPSSWSKITRLISFWWGKWALSEQSCSEYVFVRQCLLTHLWYNTYTDTQFRKLARTCKRSLFPVVCCPTVRSLLHYYLRRDDDIYPWGSALRLREKYYDYRIPLEAYSPEYSSYNVPHPLGTSDLIRILYKELSLFQYLKHRF